eukprot:TRINITY_DN63385_c0_g1_i1.p1 TRINITY_DN63385_c0_g1~~TRINITY_DN63385_c0_g1_i1.p1  ORF type:complete len:517 (-),score=24.66 TRINITY_DN63385_c0_g1_i1:833-2383(-)
MYSEQAEQAPNPDVEPCSPAALSTGSEDDSYVLDDLLGKATERIRMPWLTLIAILSALGGFLFGYDLALIGGALLYLAEDLGISHVQQEVLVSAAKYGACVGAYLGAASMLLYGRRISIALNGTLFTLGPILMAVAPWFGVLLAGRILVGVGVGLSAVVVPAYLGEMSPPSKRGRIVALYEVMLGTGMLAAGLVDTALGKVPNNWRWMVGAPIPFGILLMLSYLVLPESPRWLVSKGRIGAAKAVIERLQGFKDSSLMQNIGGEEEMTVVGGAGVPVTATPSDEPTQPTNQHGLLVTIVLLVTSLRQVVRNGEGRALIIMVVLSCFNQLTASTSIINYGPTLLEQVGIKSKQNAILMSTSIAACKLFAVCIGTSVVDGLGRRLLLLFGSFSGALTMVCLGIAVHLQQPVGTLICLCVFIITFGVSWAVCFWVQVSEFFSMQSKSPASSLATSLLFLFGALADNAFLSLIDLLGPLAFGVFAIVGVVSGLFVWFFVPETKGKPLHVVQKMFKTGQME